MLPAGIGSSLLPAQPELPQDLRRLQTAPRQEQSKAEETRTHAQGQPGQCHQHYERARDLPPGDSGRVHPHAEDNHPRRRKGVPGKKLRERSMGPVLSLMKFC